MGSLSPSHLHRFHLPRAPPLIFPRRSSLSIAAAAAQNPKHQTPKPQNRPLSSLFKPATAAAIAAAAAALAALHLHSPSPSFASAPPPLSDTLPNPTDTKERLFELRLASVPDDTDALHALMEIKLKLHKVPDAIVIVERLIRLQPDEKELLLLKAQLHNHAGEADAARRGFEEVIRKDPLAVEAYHGLVIMATQAAEEDAGDAELEGVMERVEVAMEACKREERMEELRDFKLLLAQVRVMEGEYDQALGVYRELVVEEPRDFRPYLCQGIVYTLLRKKDEAERQFEKYRRLVPKEHPYAQYIEENMALMKAVGPRNEGKMGGALGR